MTQQPATVAVLFARQDSIYKTLPGCDVFDKERNALTWGGGMPVVAHPPCRAWGGLRALAKPELGEKELALWAVDQVRAHGGVLEHPRRSLLWPAKQLPMPGNRDAFGGWSMCVPQFWWGHRAEKQTLLYVVGCDPRNIPDVPMAMGHAPRVIDTSARSKGKAHKRKCVTKPEREATPIAFALWLVELARRCSSTTRNPAHNLSAPHLPGALTPIS